MYTQRHFGLVPKKKKSEDAIAVITQLNSPLGESRQSGFDRKGTSEGKGGVMWCVCVCVWGWETHV
jgi:hypothetical protein